MQNKINTDNTEKSYKTSAETAYTIISEKILSGEFEPGCKLSRRKMAEATGVSVIPVIEALNRLEEDGLVESKPQWGSFVTVPTLEKIKEINVLREAIECQVARILSLKISALQEQELRSIANKLDNIEYNVDTLEEFTQTHYAFHSKLVEYTGYNSLVITMRRINLFSLLCNAVITRRENSTVPFPKYWHMRLIDTIMNGDPDKSEELMRIHVLDGQVLND